MQKSYFSYGKDIRIFELSDTLRRRFESKSEEYVRNIQGEYRHWSGNALAWNGNRPESGAGRCLRQAGRVNTDCSVCFELF